MQAALLAWPLELLLEFSMMRRLYIVAYRTQSMQQQSIRQTKVYYTLLSTSHDAEGTQAQSEGAERILELDWTWVFEQNSSVSSLLLPGSFWKWNTNPKPTKKRPPMNIPEFTLGTTWMIVPAKLSYCLPRRRLCVQRYRIWPMLFGQELARYRVQLKEGTFDLQKSRDAANIHDRSK